MASERHREGTLLTFPSDSDNEDIPELQSDDSVDDETKQAQYFLSGLILQFTIVAGSHAVIDKTLDNEYQTFCSRLPL